ncbi:MAG: DUF3124 domain-containing protein [Desulfovibrionaceae bacterium]
MFPAPARSASLLGLSACALLLVLTVPALAGGLSGQSVYVPAYAHIYYASKKQPFYLTITLSVRNTDAAHGITVTSVDYFDTEGTLIRHYLDKPAKLGPLGTAEYVVYEKDSAGGAGANFVVRWKSDVPVNEPIVESVMIGTASGQGISFTSRGEAIEEPAH